MRTFAFAIVLALIGASFAGPLQAAPKSVPNVLPSEQCDTCTFIVDVLHNLMGQKIIEDCIVDFVIYICETFKIEDNFVCSTLLRGYEDEVTWVLGQIIVEPQQICGLLLKDCGHIFNPLNGTWSVPIPGTQPPYKPPPTPPKGKPTLRVLHLTDVHVDMFYEPGLEADCGEPQCCRTPHNPNEITEGKSAAASTAAPIKKAAGYWGTIANCDVPYYLFQNTLQRIKDNHKDLDYIIVTGDLESHAIYDYTRPVHQNMIRNISDTIRSYFPTIPVYFAVGNHEGIPVDTFAPRFTPERFHMDWLYNTMADSWKGWVPEDQDASMRFFGNYVVKPFPGLRIISLNTPLAGDSVNFFMYVNQTDPDGTMTWLVNQLYEAEQAGEKVHISAHIPGSDAEALEGWALNYNKLVTRFANTIAAQFFGHMHSEEFYMMYADPENAKSQPTGVIYSAPSVTSYSDFNPAYRIYTIDGNYPGSTFSVIDFEEWFFDLEKNTDASKSEWTQLYKSILQEYGLKDTSPEEWNKMIERMKTDDVLFEKYRKNYYRRTDVGPCDAKCKAFFLCSCRMAHHTLNLCTDLEANTGVSRPIFYRKPPSQHVPSQEEVDALIARVKTTNYYNDDCKFNRVKNVK